MSECVISSEWRHESWRSNSWLNFSPLWQWTIKIFYFVCSIYSIVRRRGVVGRILAFQPGGQGSIPGGFRNFNFYSGTGCVPFVFCSVWSIAVALTLCWSHMRRGPLLCTCLVFWFRVCCSIYRHLTHGNFGIKSRGV